MEGAHRDNETPQRRRRTTSTFWFISAVTALVGIAAFLRFYRLGILSLAGDEETTTLAAEALLRGWPPTLPGGLVYLRGLPFTALEALALGVLGFDELTLRLVPALVALPRIVIAFWLARAMLPGAFALAPAALIAVAPLDVELSRTARMYSLFMTFDALFLVAAVELARSGRGALRASVWGALSLVTHSLTALHVPLLLLGLFRRTDAAEGGEPSFRTTAPRVAAVVAVLAAVYLLYDALLSSAYSGMGGEQPGPAPSPLGSHLAALRASMTGAGGPIAASAILVGLVLAATGARSLRSPLAALLSLVAVGLCAGASPVLGLPGLLTALAWAGIGPFAAPYRAPRLLLAAALPVVGWGAAAALAVEGAAPAAGAASAVRLLLSFPAPNWVEPVLAAPALTAIVALGVLVAFDRAARNRSPGVWLILVGAALAPALLGGLVARKEALRYQAHALMPSLVLAAIGARWAAQRLRLRGRAAATATLLVAGAAVRPDLALDAALRRHGPVASPFAVLPVAPDHRGAARFLAARADPEDPVVAEDPLQMQVYLGRAEYWLRRIEDAGTFVMRYPDGTLRDAYVGARLVTNLGQLEAELAASGVRSAWLVTSGEVEIAPTWYRTPETRIALEAWRPLAWFVGDDGLTRVYRLDNGIPVGPEPGGAVGRSGDGAQ